MTRQGESVHVPVGVVLALAAVAACRSPEASPAPESRSPESPGLDARAPEVAWLPVSDLRGLFGKAEDQRFELAGGRELLLWNYAMHFSELEPPRFSWAVLVADGSVVGMQKLFPGAQVRSAQDVWTTVDEQHMDVLTDEAAPGERKLDVLRALGWPGA